MRIVTMRLENSRFNTRKIGSRPDAYFSLRNSCAHHSRVWNRVFGVKPSIPGKNKNPDWHNPPFVADRVGLQLTICHYWLGKITSTTQWRQRVVDLFNQ